MWGLVCHRALWGMFSKDGDSTSTPFLHLQGFDLQKDPQRPALASPRVPFWSSPFPPVCPRAWLEPLALVNRQSFTLCPKHHGPRGCRCLGSERLCGAEGRSRPAAGPGGFSRGSLWAQSRAGPAAPLWLSLPQVHPLPQP